MNTLRTKEQDSFTLLELIIVVIIIGILASLAIPIYINTIEKQRGEVCINNMRTIFAAWRIYKMKNPNFLIGGFQNVNQINTRLGIAIDERHFGSNSVYGFSMEENTTIPYYYYLSTYRQGGLYNGRRIYCNYYPNGNSTGNHYDWGGNWPWLPPDE